MVSRLPVFSGKRFGTRVPPEMVGPLIVLVVLAIALLIAYPWMLLTAGTLAYLAACRSAGCPIAATSGVRATGKAEPAPARPTPPTLVPD